MDRAVQRVSSARIPTDDPVARVLWRAADARGVTCRCADVPERSCAVSIGHDLNGNQRVDDIKVAR